MGPAKNVDDGVLIEGAESERREQRHKGEYGGPRGQRWADTEEEFESAVSIRLNQLFEDLDVVGSHSVVGENGVL